MVSQTSQPVRRCFPPGRACPSPHFLNSPTGNRLHVSISDSAARCLRTSKGQQQQARLVHMQGTMSTVHRTQPLNCPARCCLPSHLHHLRQVQRQQAGRSIAVALAAAAADPTTAEEGAQPAPLEQPTTSTVADTNSEVDPSASASNGNSSSNGRSAEEATALLLAQIRAEVARRRNFAIISHPVSVIGRHVRPATALPRQSAAGP
jgi:hypothetical protein